MCKCDGALGMGQKCTECLEKLVEVCEEKIEFYEDRLSEWEVTLDEASYYLNNPKSNKSVIQ